MAHTMGSGRRFSPVTRKPLDTRRALGRSGEDRAAAWYVGHGYRIVDRNWRSRIGEIDLVCAGHGVLVFCEVKARGTDRLGAPAEAVTGTKQRRLRRLAALYLLWHTCGDHEVRFDVAAVRGTTVTVIEGAF
ncbi:MAG: YraN family protein [Acidimicrobiales bacterium]